MARPPFKLTTDVEAEIKLRTARGESAKTVHSAMSGRVEMPSIATLARIQAKLKTEGFTEVAKVDLTSDIPDNVSETTPVADLTRWIKLLEHAMSVAESNGNLGAIASLASKLGNLTSLLHKLTPIPKADPNEDLDLIALAKAGEDRLLLLVKNMFEQP